jgi:predicted amino acid dehydrogenase
LDVTADYYVLSKSLGGGISKISAMLIDSKMYRDDFSMIHSSTFAEDDHSASIAIKALEILEQNDNEIYKRCIERGTQLISVLNFIKEKYPMVIKEIRGKGLMLGIEFHRQEDTDSGVFNMIAAQNLLGYIVSGYLLHEHRIRVAPTLSSNTTIRLEPSAFISENDCNTVLNAIDRLCEIIYKRNIFALIKFVVNAESYNSYPEIKNYRTIKRDDHLLHDTNQQVKKVAFLGHFIEPEHLILWDNSFSEFSKDQMEMFIENLYELIDPILSDECIVTSTTGDKVHLVFIGVFVTSKIITRQMNNRDLTVILDKIDKAIEMAKHKNCKVVGFGGFTSIITNNCKKIVTDSIGLTSGNSLTVAMGLKAMQKAARKVGIDMEAACFAAIGAAGNIASIYSEILANSVQRVILIGNNGREERSKIVAERIYQNVLEEILKFNSNTLNADNNDLKGIAKAIYNTKTIQNILMQNGKNEETGKDLFIKLAEELGENVPIIVTSDYSYLKEADLILGASNTSDPIIFPEMLGEQKVVICDIAIPADVDASVVNNCENVMLIKGGLVKLPHNPEFIIRGIPLEKGEAFACMSETLLLGLSGIHDDYSIGSIHKNQVNKIMEIAKIHGFELGKLKTDASF